MIIDTSALLAIVLDEEDADRMSDALTKDSSRKMSAANWFEACMVVDNRDILDASVKLDSALKLLKILIVPFDSEQAAIARTAHSRFGRKKDKKRGLNYGDCMAYALSKATGEPLLFKGNDFSLTDVASVLA